MVQPYRSAPNEPNATVSFGDEKRRRLNMVLGILLVLSAVAVVALWLWVGEHIQGSVFLPAVFGVLLLARSRSGTLELARAERELRVKVRRFGPTLRERVPIDDLEGVTVVPSSFTSKNPEYLLQLLRKSGSPLTLLRASKESELEPSRARVGDFLLEHGLLTPRVRIDEEPAPQPVAAEPEEEEDEAERTPGRKVSG